VELKNNEIRKHKKTGYFVVKAFGLGMCHNVEIFFRNHHKGSPVSMLGGAELGCYGTAIKYDKV